MCKVCGKWIELVLRGYCVRVCHSVCVLTHYYGNAGVCSRLHLGAVVTAILGWPAIVARQTSTSPPQHPAGRQQLPLSQHTTAPPAPRPNTPPRRKTVGIGPRIEPGGRCWGLLRYHFHPSFRNSLFVKNPQICGKAFQLLSV